MPSLIKYLESVVPGKGPLRDRLTAGNNWELVEKALVGREVVTTHYKSPTQRSFVVVGVSREPAVDKRFEKGGHYFTVGEYYWRKHAVKIQPGVPCVLEEHDGGKGHLRQNFWPMDVLEVL